MFSFPNKIHLTNVKQMKRYKYKILGVIIMMKISIINMITHHIVIAP